MTEFQTSLLDEDLNNKTADELRKLARQKGYHGTKVQELKKHEIIHLIKTGEFPEETQHDLAKIIAEAVQSHIKAPEAETVDKAQVIDIVKEVLKEESLNMETIRDLVSQALNSTIKTIEVNTPESKKIDVGMQHKIFEKLLRRVNMGKHIWLYGEAGSGKTHVAESISKALDIPFYSQSVTIQTTKSDLFGFINANGEYVPSHFYNAYKNGGVFCLDEVDNGNPNVLNVLNAATSNGHAYFPHERAEKHKDFRLVACANTVGDGASRQYIGRNALDAALKSRFVFIEMDTDWKLVEAVVTAKHGSKGKEFYDTCMKLKDQMNNLYSKDILLTSRTVFDGADIYTQGEPLNDVLDEVLFKGCDENTRSKILSVI